MHTTSRLTSVLVASALATFVPSVAVGIEIDPASYIEVTAFDGTASSSQTTVYGLVNPNSQLVTGTDGLAFSSTNVSHGGSGEQVILLHEFDHHRAGSYYSGAYSNGWIRFSVAAATTYDVSGLYAVEDVSTAGFVHFESRLLKMDSFENVYIGHQSSEWIQDPEFALGGLGGNSAAWSGSLSGVLDAGTYQWSYHVFTRAYPNADGGASATGFMKLELGGGAATSVPESGSATAVVSLGLAGLAALRRKLLATTPEA